MQIKTLRISNILSFPFRENIQEAQSIEFDEGLNIIIGENGSGKSTALEVINFLFKRVLFRQYNFNQEMFERRSRVTAQERLQILAPNNDNRGVSNFRLEPNWNSEAKPQLIRIQLILDDIDTQNIRNLQESIDNIYRSADGMTPKGRFDKNEYAREYTIDVKLNRAGNDFTVSVIGGQKDFGFEYLTEYQFYKELIQLHNLANPTEPIAGLSESFTIISSYRNYHSFQRSVSLSGAQAWQQIRDIRTQDYSRSLNTSDTNEPPIFSLVRLRVAEKHFEMIPGKRDQAECDKFANDLPFMHSINERLKLINLECRIQLTDLRTWQYSFNFFDQRRGKPIADINSLSAGQKAIIHLVFEAYGRGDLKGGVVIIDEPEIHLHYQFQHEYLSVIRDLNAEQNCQYILVTHSEALINSETIRSVRRFSLSATGETLVNAPTLQEDQKTLIKILDNTRSTYAFFAKKVVLVEGDTDRYFFTAALARLFPGLGQEVAFLAVGGKGSHRDWRQLFARFGLSVYVISDFDYLSNLHYPDEIATQLKTAEAVASFKARHVDWAEKIELERESHTYILRDGDLERYLGIGKGLQQVIDFCEESLEAFLALENSAASAEIKGVLEIISR